MEPGERVVGDRVVMEKNPDYWGGNPKVGPFLDRIVIKPVADASARVAGLRGGSAAMESRLGEGPPVRLVFPGSTPPDITAR